MLRTPFISLGLMLALTLVTSLPARADDSAAAQSTSNNDQSWFQKHGKASYLLWLQQMHTESLSGNRSGKGTDLDFDHFFSVGAKLTKELSLSGTVWASQILDEDGTNRQWQPGDMYFTLSDSKIYHNDRYAVNVDGYLRAYAPTSLNTRDNLNKGTTRDIGHGMVRALVNPSKSWLDGKLTLNGLFYANFRFNSMTPQERFDRGTRQFALDPTTKASSYREDMYFVFDPSLVYSVSPKVDVYVEWTPGVLRHTTSGVITEEGVTHPVESRWSSSNHPSDGMYLSPGIYWNPTKRINVNPYLTYQLSAVHSPDPVKRRVSLFHADVGLQLQYSFL